MKYNEMTKAQFDDIMRHIYENGRVAADGDDCSSQTAEFEFEASERGFSDDAIAEARRRFD